MNKVEGLDSQSMNTSDTEAAAFLKNALARCIAKAGAHLSTTDAAKVALVATCRDREDLINTLFASREARSLTSQTLDACVLTPVEFGALVRFCVAFVSPDQERLCEGDDARSASLALERALVCTLGESRQRDHWKNAPVRIAAALAMNFAEPQDFVDAGVWGLVRADARRLEELRQDVESSPLQLLFVGEAVTALASSF